MVRRVPCARRFLFAKFNQLLFSLSLFFFKRFIWQFHAVNDNSSIREIFVFLIEMCGFINSNSPFWDVELFFMLLEIVHFRL